MRERTTAPASDDDPAGGATEAPPAAAPFPSRYREPADSPGFLLWQVTMRWQRRQRAALEPLGLTHAQFILLAGVAWLARAGEPVAQVDLARFMAVDVMMTSEVVRALERKGLVERARHPRDARARSLALTPAGSAAIQRALPLVEQADAAFFAAVGESTGEFTRLLRDLFAGEADTPRRPMDRDSSGE